MLSPGPFSSVDPPALCHYLFRNLPALKQLPITRWDKLKVALFSCHCLPCSRRQLLSGNFLTLLLFMNMFLTKGGFGTVEWVDTWWKISRHLFPLYYFSAMMALCTSAKPIWPNCKSQLRIWKVNRSVLTLLTRHDRWGLTLSLFV